jgi:flagellar hook-associated protein 3 FlgL
MISTLNPVNQSFVNSVDQITQQLNNDQLEITSGVTMQNVSDSPDQVSELLQARASLAASQQISTNLTSVTTEVNTGEQALESAVQLFDQVQTLAATSATGTATAATRAQNASQLQSVEQQLVGLANTNIEGRYIFSGDSDQAAPYNYDPTQADPVSAYQGSASTREIQSANGTTFPVALTAQQIFDSTDPTTNIFTTINNLVTAMNNNDQPTLESLVDGLSGVSAYLNQQLAFYGTTQDNVQSATDYAQTQQTQLQTQISNLQDADSTSVILNMTQTQTQLEAAMQSKAEIPQTTLFQYISSD